MDRDVNRLLKTIGTIVVILIILLFSISSTVAEEKRVDIGSLIKELMQMRIEPTVRTMAVWLPTELFEAAFAAHGVPESRATPILDLLRPYTIIMLNKADVGPMGAQTFVSEPDLRRDTRLVDAAGNRYTPIQANEIPPDINILLENMRPAIERSAGPAGKHMYLMVFWSANKTGARIGEATRQGRFSVAITDQMLHWRTPLGSLVPPKKDPMTGEILSGAWTYSPWTGVKLVPVEQ